MIRKKSFGNFMFDAVTALLLLLIFVIMVYPFLYVINFSISSLSEREFSPRLRFSSSSFRRPVSSTM